MSAAIDLADASPGSDCWESIKAPAAEHCVAFQGMPTPLSVITGSCHHGAVRWMQKRSQQVQRRLQEEGVAAPFIKQEMDPDPDGYAYAWNQCLICAVSLFWLIFVPTSAMAAAAPLLRIFWIHFSVTEYYPFTAARVKCSNHWVPPQIRKYLTFNLNK